MRLLEKEKKIAAEKVNEFILDQQQLQSKFDQKIGKYVFIQKKPEILFIFLLKQIKCTYYGCN